MPWQKKVSDSKTIRKKQTDGKKHCKVVLTPFTQSKEGNADC